MSKTIDGFRSFFKSSDKKESIDLDKLIESVFTIIGTSIKNNNIELQLDLNNKNELFVFQNQLKQVVLNLLKNSEDILIERNIENPYIKVSTYIEDDRNVIEVLDNGGGIQTDVIDKIFDPYFTTKSEKNGAGLGLYISKMIVEKQCKGELSVESLEGKTKFKLYLSSQKERID